MYSIQDYNETEFISERLHIKLSLSVLEKYLFSQVILEVAQRISRGSTDRLNGNSGVPTLRWKLSVRV